MEKELKEYNGIKLSSLSEFRENSIKGPQSVDIKNYTLEIYEEGIFKKAYRYEEVINNFKATKKIITLYCVEGWDTTILYEGINLIDILNDSNVSFKYPVIIFGAVDGYTTSLETSFVLNSKLIIAYKMNGITIPKENGFPFVLIGENKWGYKWIKWLNRIELSNDKDYRGYWESRGYSNSANLNEPFFER
ncbi:MAG: molybdopterin-dependent oxidoreductase [Caldisericia bacterium]|jgi:DMSO/TMAO reductase YedYZ molybdopterin-dependent catalytic subunit|nr:molybdopterin-dependent oxidoreductase [Caldisericia bacterium]